jgi:hypothetical protein
MPDAGIIPGATQTVERIEGVSVSRVGRLCGIIPTDADAAKFSSKITTQFVKELRRCGVFSLKWLFQNAKLDAI